MENLNKIDILFNNYNSDYSVGAQYILSKNLYNYKNIFIVIEDHRNDNFTQYIPTQIIKNLREKEISFSTTKIDFGITFSNNNTIEISYSNIEKAHIVLVAGVN